MPERDKKTSRHFDEGPWVETSRCFFFLDSMLSEPLVEVWSIPALLSTLILLQEATESAENIRQDIHEMKNRFDPNIFLYFFLCNCYICFVYNCNNIISVSDMVSLKRTRSVFHAPFPC